jgi:hypothetical protein
LSVSFFQICTRIIESKGCYPSSKRKPVTFKLKRDASRQDTFSSEDAFYKHCVASAGVHPPIDTYKRVCMVLCRITPLGNLVSIFGQTPIPRPYSRIRCLIVGEFITATVVSYALQHPQRRVIGATAAICRRRRESHVFVGYVKGREGAQPKLRNAATPQRINTTNAL